jgi:hypothetical protein
MTEAAAEAEVPSTLQAQVPATAEVTDISKLNYYKGQQDYLILLVLFFIYY